MDSDISSTLPLIEISIILRGFPLSKGNKIIGEMAEWSKAHAWKVCIWQRIEGSNPSLSAI